MTNTEDQQGEAPATEAYKCKTEFWLPLYDLAVDEHHFWNEARDRFVSVYAGILSALVTATVAGLFALPDSSEPKWYYYVSLCIGPVLVLALSCMARKGVHDQYKTILQAITRMAKIEHRLGIAEDSCSDADDPGAWLACESIVLPERICSRKKHTSARNFVCYHLKRKTGKVYRAYLCMFTVFGVLGGVMLTGLLCLAACRLWHALIPCLRALYARLALLFCPI